MATISYTPRPLPRDQAQLATYIQDELRRVSLLWPEPGTSAAALEDFGLVGDGVEDDTDALDAAFTYFGSAGERFYVPPGTYLISSTIAWAITNGFWIECSPHAVFRASPDLPVDSKLFLPSASSGAQRFVWRGGTVDGRSMPARSVGAPDLLYIASQYIKDVTVDGVSFVVNDTRAGSAGDSCLFLAEGEDYRVTGCTFKGAPDTGIYISGDNGGTLGRRALVCGNTFLECGDAVISKRKFEDHIVGQNFVVNCDVGIVIGGETSPGLLTASKAIIAGNLLRNTMRGIEARVADGTLIHGNRIEDFGYNASGAAVAETAILVSGSEHCLVSGNVIAVASGSPHTNATAVKISPRTVDGTVYESEYTRVSNNVIVGAPRGVVEEPNSDSTTVESNTIIGASTEISLTGANSRQGVFGAHSALGAEVLSGYITITDATGAARKIAVVS